MEAGTLTLVGRRVLRAVGLLPRRMKAVDHPHLPGGMATMGAFRASGDISLRPGTFDAVGDRIPVPGRARCPLREGMHPAARNVPASKPRQQAAGAPTDYSGIPRLKIINKGTTPATRICNSTTSTKISDPFSVRDMPRCFPMLSAPGSPRMIEAR